jgi:hypothetical protein
MILAQQKIKESIGFKYLQKIIGNDSFNPNRGQIKNP